MNRLSITLALRLDNVIKKPFEHAAQDEEDLAQGLMMPADAALVCLLLDKHSHGESTWLHQTCRPVNQFSRD